MELGFYFLFLQEQIKDIIIKRARAATCCHRNRCMGMLSLGHHSSLQSSSLTQ
jgi:hypothetical protein